MGEVAFGVMLTTSAEVQNTCSCTYTPPPPISLKGKGKRIKVKFA